MLPPPVFSISGTAYFTPRNRALVSIDMPMSQPSSDTVTALPHHGASRESVGKAFWTRISSRPHSPTVASTMFRMSSCFEMSVWTARALPPASVIRSTFVPAASSLKSAMSTLAPSSASLRAVAPPMPSAPPVTMATWPSNLPISKLSLSFIRCARRVARASCSVGHLEVVLPRVLREGDAEVFL